MYICTLGTKRKYKRRAQFYAEGHPSQSMERTQSVVQFLLHQMDGQANAVGSANKRFFRADHKLQLAMSRMPEWFERIHAPDWNAG